MSSQLLSPIQDQTCKVEFPEIDIMHCVVCNLVRQPYLVILLVQKRSRKLLRRCLRHAFLSAHGKGLLSGLGKPFCLDPYAMGGRLNELKKERRDGTY